MKNTAALIYKWLYERNKMMHQMVGVWKDCSLLNEENFCVLYRRKMREGQKKVNLKRITLCFLKHTSV